MANQLEMFRALNAPEVVPGLRYVPEFLLRPTELAVLAEVDSRPWLPDLRRRVQHYGYKYDYKARSINHSMFVGKLPPFAIELGHALIEAKFLEQLPDQMIVNEYLPGQGISAHIDCVPCFQERIVTISLGSACEMEFIPKGKGRMTETITLEPRSALLMSGEARRVWQHSIRARLTDHGRRRTRRVSLTFRNVVLQP